MFKLFRLLNPYKFSVAAIIALMLLQSLSQLYLPTLLSDIVDVGVLHGDVAYIIRYGAYMLLVAMGAMVCVMIASYLLARTATGFGRDLRRKLLAMSKAFHYMNLTRSAPPPLLHEPRMISHKFSKLLL